MAYNYKTEETNHLLNEELRYQCHKELDGKKRPLGIASYEDKIVQLGLKKILKAGVLESRTYGSGKDFIS